MNHLLRLTYVSKASLPVDRVALKALLEVCHDNNTALGITGVLCAGRGYFLQTLEGPEDSVIRMYSRILEDERHEQCSLLDIGLIESPMFGQWAMGFIDGDVAIPRLYAELVESRSLNEKSERTSRLMQTFLERLGKLPDLRKS